MRGTRPRMFLTKSGTEVAQGEKVGSLRSEPGFKKKGIRTGKKARRVKTKGAHGSLQDLCRCVPNEARRSSCSAGEVIRKAQANRSSKLARLLASGLQESASVDRSLGVI